MSRGKKNKKDRKRRVRVDEVFTAGPVTVARSGRVTQISANWSPEQYAAMRRGLPKRVEGLKATIDDHIRTLVSQLRQYSPIEFIRALFIKNCLVNPETYSEPEHEGNEAYVEYAQSLTTALHDPGQEQPSKATVDTFCNLVTEVLQEVVAYFGLREPKDVTGEPGRSLDAEEARFTGMLRHLLLRGSSIREHDTELVLALFEPHDAFFKDHGLFTARQLIGFSEDVLNAAQHTTNNAVDAFRQLRDLHAQFVERLDKDPDLDPTIVMRELRESEAGKAAVKAYTDSAQLPYDVVPYSDANKVICDTLSLSPGDNTEFLTFAKSPGWPSNNTKIALRPLMRIGATYHCPNPILLLRNRGDILEDLIREADPEYFEKKFAKKRGQIAEDLAVQHFRRLLPSASVFRNMYYEMEHDGELRRYETDALLLFDNVLFIVETKSAPLSTAALRGAERALSKELGHLITEPYEQATRTLKFIKSSPSARFDNEDGSHAVTVEEKKLRRVYLVNVTLADIGHIAARLNSAKAMGLLSGREWPWSIFVNDLRIISEIIETPPEFLLFLERRLAVNDFSAIGTLDEVDYLGWFLRDGLYFEASDVKGFHRFSPVGYTVPIERYFDRLAGRVSSGDKPRLNITDGYRRLVGQIHDCGLDGAIRAAVALLSLSGARQHELEEWYDKYSRDTESTGTSHTLTLIGPDGPSLVLALAQPGDSTTIEKTKEYARMKRVQTQVETLIVVVLEVPGARPAEIVILEGTVEESTGLATKMKAFKSAKLRDHIERFGMPSRNDRCPCNSGRKFKKCCYLEM